MAISNSTQFHIVNVTSASIPMTGGHPIEGAFYVYQEGLYCAFDASSVPRMLGQITRVASLAAVTNPVAERYYVDTTAGTLNIHNGTTWQQIGGTAQAGAVGSGSVDNLVIALPSGQLSRSDYTITEGTESWTGSDTALPTEKKVAEYVLTATSDKANVLVTARTFSISGGATAAAVSFNGSANVVLNVTALNAANLSGAIPSAVTATTQTAGTNDTTIATTAFVSAAITTAVNNINTNLTNNFYTKTEIDTKLSAVYRYRGSVNTFADLPTTDRIIGDVWNVITPNGMNYAWNGTEWDALGGAVDISNFVTLDTAQTITGVKTFSNTIVGSISGNAGTATILATARTFSISGGATAAAVSFNGSANVVLNVTALDSTLLTNTINISLIPTTNTLSNDSNTVPLTSAVWEHSSSNASGIHGATSTPIASRIIQYNASAKINSTSTVAGDTGTTVTTKDYVDNLIDTTKITWTVV
jgi:hypothetical protein